MIKSIRLENFQSHTKLNIDNLPEKGLLVIEGPNSVGKTAIIRAIKNSIIEPAWHNKSQRLAAIKKGNLTSTIEIELYEMEDKIVIHLEDESTNSYYKIGDQLLFVYKDRREIRNLFREKLGLSKTNIHMAMDRMPFINTEGSENKRDFDVVFTDEVAVKIIENGDASIEITKNKIKDLERDVLSLTEQYHLVQEDPHINSAQYLSSKAKEIRLANFMQSIDINRINLFTEIELPKTNNSFIPADINKVKTISAIPKLNPICITIGKVRTISNIPLIEGKFIDIELNKIEPLNVELFKELNNYCLYCGAKKGVVNYGES